MLSNRSEAGKLLAEKLSHLKGNEIAVLAIPRGGVVVGDEIAKALGCTLDVVISKKINPPGHPEYAIGAIMPDGTTHWNEDMSKFMQNPYLINEINEKKSQAQRNLLAFRQNEDYNLYNKTVILVDDGIATGSSVFVILKWLTKHNPKKTVVAAPVIPAQTYEEIKKVSEVAALLFPSAFYAVSDYYEEFKQVSDEQVKSILEKYRMQ